MRGENLTLYIGPMFCEKSKHLVMEYRRAVALGERVVAFKPGVDSGRYKSGAYIQSKEEEYRAPARLIDHRSPEIILEYVEQEGGVQKVIIDEGSFYPTEQFVAVVAELTDRGIKVIVGGLTHFSTKEPWGALLGLTKVEGARVHLLHSRCDGESGKCKEGAVWSYEKVPKKDQLTVGDGGIYGACCQQHYNDLHKGEVWQG